MAATKVYKSDKFLDNKYCVNVTAKTRYVVPLVLTENKVDRINNVSQEANQYISDYLKLPKGGYWTYFDFDFKPIENKVYKK